MAKEMGSAIMLEFFADLCESCLVEKRWRWAEDVSFCGREEMFWCSQRFVSMMLGCDFALWVLCMLRTLWQVFTCYIHLLRKRGIQVSIFNNEHRALVCVVAD